MTTNHGFLANRDAMHPTVSHFAANQRLTTGERRTTLFASEAYPMGGIRRKLFPIVLLLACTALAFPGVAPARPQQAAAEATTNAGLQPILEYISKGWDTSTRSMSDYDDRRFEAGGEIHSVRPGQFRDTGQRERTGG
jgi:hypothetical protein